MLAAYNQQYKGWVNTIRIWIVRFSGFLTFLIEKKMKKSFTKKLVPERLNVIPHPPKSCDEVLRKLHVRIRMYCILLISNAVKTLKILSELDYDAYHHRSAQTILACRKQATPAAGFFFQIQN